MLQNISAKNKTMIFVTILLVIFSATLLGTVYFNQKTRLEAVEHEYYSNIKNSYEKIIDRHKLFYTNRARANISSYGIGKALAEKDRATLIKLSMGRWKTLSRENEFLKVMHFHSADGTSLVRMHRQEMFGDKISDMRPMVRQIHTEHKPVYGFEAGMYYLAYRTILPVFYENRYVGALEFGSRPDLFLSEMSYYNNLKGALFVSNAELNLYKEKSNFAIGNYVLQYQNFKAQEILNELKSTGYNFENYTHIHYDERAYNVYSFNIHDFNGNIVAKTILLHDISDLERVFFRAILKLATMLFFLLVGLLFIINMGFKKIISALDTSNVLLAEKEGFLQLILDNTAHAVVVTKPDGTITLFNKKAEAMLGYSAEEVVGQTTPIQFHKEIELKEKAHQQSVKYGQEIDAGFEAVVIEAKLCGESSEEWTYVSRDAYEFPINLNISPIEDEKKNITGYVGICEDISVRKILETKMRKQKDELEAIFHTSPDGIGILDMETNFLFFNKAYEELTGYTREELLKKSCLELTLEKDKEKSIEAIRYLSQTGFLDGFEKRCVTKSGKIINVRMSFVLMPDKKRFLTTSRDITNLKKSEKQLHDYMELIDQHTLASASDTNGDYTYVSEGLCKISGYTKQELIGENHRILRHEDVGEEFINNALKIVMLQGRWAGEVKNRAKDGSAFWVKTHVSLTTNDDGVHTGFTSISHDITDKKLIEQISITDGLTGIYNRRHFNDVFPKYVNIAKRHNEIINFVILDIDHFKQYNDTYGHQMGDKTLINIAECMQETMMRADDSCFRLGGEEFGVLYKTSDTDSAIAIAEKLRQGVEQMAIPHKASETKDTVTISLGLVCRYAEDIHSTDELYAHADRLLYRAKMRGRNRLEHSLPEDAES